MTKLKSDKLSRIGNRTYFYDSKKGILTIFTLSGKEHKTFNITKEAWENEPKFWSEMIQEAKSNDYQLTDKDKEEIAVALNKATDWKQARINKSKGDLK